MSKIEIKKTELVWRGKYDDEGRLVPIEKPGPFPFQIVESINDPRIEKGDAQATQTSLFDIWKGDEGTTFEDGWKNKLIWGDNKFVMSSLLEKFAGKIDLIYIDPPFATGADFRTKIKVGERKEEIVKGHSVIEEKAYRDTWGAGNDSFISMMYERISLIHELLSDKGLFCLHVDYRLTAHLRLILDEIFGPSRLVNEIIWHYQSGGRQENSFSFKHDTIWIYSKGEKWTFDIESIGIERGSEKRNNMKREIDPDGRVYFTIKSAGKIYKYYEDEKMTPPDVWTDINHLQQKDPERVDYPTQKPENLLKKIINGLTEPNSLVADVFVGSGTTCCVAEKLNRRWIGVDLGRYAIHTTRKRLLELELSKSLTDIGKKYGKKVKPFEILNLGKYERQFWQVKAFGKKDEKQAMYEYLAFILKLYGAEPITGSSHIHGKKGNALVYIGAVDAPVTIQEVADALKDTKDMGQKELHVLGWEWEMGLNDAIQEVAKQMAVRLKLRIIPMDAIDPQAAGKGDVKFFELAYFKTEIESKGLKAKVKLEDFVIPHTDLIPPDVKESIKKWSDWIDYWAVDFEFQNDTFNNGWTSYRTKKERTLRLAADYEYPKAGTYKIFVKIIDIFGIDTSQVYEIKVK
ncbi:MAG: site-specific DNA-methyltransferase [Bacteroidales bacterium]|nr:site-specific DNA-methyltransferase [Bacteroidales bacterium]